MATTKHLTLTRMREMSCYYNLIDIISIYSISIWKEFLIEYETIFTLLYIKMHIWFFFIFITCQFLCVYCLRLWRDTKKISFTLSRINGNTMFFFTSLNPLPPSVGNWWQMVEIKLYITKGSMKKFPMSVATMRR